LCYGPVGFVPLAASRVDVGPADPADTPARSRPERRRQPRSASAGRGQRGASPPGRVSSAAWSRRRSPVASPPSGGTKSRASSAVLLIFVFYSPTVVPVNPEVPGGSPQTVCHSPGSVGVPPALSRPYGLSRRAGGTRSRAAGRPALELGEARSRARQKPVTRADHAAPHRAAIASKGAGTRGREGFPQQRRPPPASTGLANGTASD